MKKILLAITGTSPSRRVFRYAVQLCKRIKAELNILEVIDTCCRQTLLTGAKGKSKIIREYFEKSMAAVAFAEADDPRTAREMTAQALENLRELLSESKQAGIKYHLTIRSGAYGNEIVRYMEEHPDVVLAVCDGARGHSLRKNRPGVLDEIGQGLGVPVVVVRG